MRILAIDPGDKESGYVIWDGYQILDKGIVDTQSMIQVIKDCNYDLCLIEMIACYGMAVGKEVFDTCRVVGKFEYACPTKYELVYRKDVKLWHCNSIRANDANITASLKSKYGDKGTKKNPGSTYGLSKHMWQAFAIATMYTEKINLGIAS